MKKVRAICTISLILAFAVVASACSSAEKSTSSSDNGRGVNYDATASEPQAVEQETAEYGDANAKLDGSAVEFTSFEEDKLTSTSAISGESIALQTQDKIIRTFNLQVETQEFDPLISKLDSEISRLNGYVETSRISGKSYLSSGGVRSASITARIPRDRVDEFVNVVGENANVIDKQETTENVTLQYTDIESRKKTLEIEQERLFALLEKTDSMENIVTLESRLSDIRYELQNYETTLRTYDNKVEYSTVTLSVQEVEILTPKVETKQTVGIRISNGFGNTVRHIGEGAKNFFVWFVVNLPYLLIWGVVIAVIILIIRKAVKRYNKRYDKTITPPSDTVQASPKDKEE